MYVEMSLNLIARVSVVELCELDSGLEVLGDI